MRRARRYWWAVVLVVVVALLAPGTARASGMYGSPMTNVPGGTRASTMPMELVTVSRYVGGRRSALALAGV